MGKKNTRTVAMKPKEPIMFFGEPYRLKGKIPLVNHLDKPIRKTRIRVEKCKLNANNGGPLTEIVVRQSLQPGQETMAFTSLAIDRFTPPGMHKANLKVEGELYDVIFHVAESIDLEIAPREIYITAKSKSKIKKTIYITNNGNVPLLIGEIGAIGLEENDILCRSIRGAVRQLKEVKMDTALEALVKELEKAYLESKVIFIRTTDQPVEVSPGDSIALELEITLPQLTKHHWYNGYLNLYNASVAIFIHSV